MSKPFYDFWLGEYRVRLSEDERTAEVFVAEALLHTATAELQPLVDGEDESTPRKVITSATVLAQRWICLHKCGSIEPDQPPAETPVAIASEGEQSPPAAVAPTAPAGPVVVDSPISSDEPQQTESTAEESAESNDEPTELEDEETN